MNDASTRKALARIERQFNRFEALLPRCGDRAARISGWSVGQHLDHLMKADRTILHAIEEPDEGPLPPVSTIGRIVLWSGWIPRGRGRAPNATQPDEPDREILAGEIRAVRQFTGQVVEPLDRLLEPAPVSKHPYFGGLSAAQWIRFIEVHHRHHHKIISDILRADPA